MPHSRPGEQTQRLLLFLAVLVPSVAILAILTAPVLWIIDTVLSPLPIHIVTSTAVPRTSRISFALAGIPVALFVAEYYGFFPGLPKRMTEWMDDLEEIRYWRVLLTLLPGIVVMAVAAIISLNWFT